MSRYVGRQEQARAKAGAHARNRQQVMHDQWRVTSVVALRNQRPNARCTPSRRYGARPGRRGWLCEPHAIGHSVAPPNPAGVLEVLAWSPAVQKAAGLLSRSCRNRREHERPPPTGRVPHAQQDPGVAGKLQLAILEKLLNFLETYC